MPEKKAGASNVTVPIQVTVKLQESPTGERPPQAIAYAFTGSGRQIARAPLDAKGNATLQVPAFESAQEVRVLVGPEIEAAPGQLTYSELARRGGEGQFLRVSIASKELRAIFDIPHAIWVCWLRLCMVKGTLLKRVYSGGIPVDYPVCGAEVKIWEVDPIHLIIYKLRDFDLERIRHFLVHPHPVPPGPDPGPGPLHRLAELGRMEVAQPLPTAQQFSQASPQFEEAHRAALMGNLELLRQSLVMIDVAALRFLICRLFPHLVIKQLIGTATTDRCGHFQKLIFVGCYDKPDLYFTASVNFGFFSLPIYAPTPVSCYTHWNYPCGTEVTLYTTSPFAPLCTPCTGVDAPENYVLFRALGNVQLNKIYGTSAPLAGATTADNTGQAANLYGTGYDSPFGGTVRPRVEFDSSLRATGRAMYYQISYRKGTSGDFTVLAGQIDRKYNHYVGTDLVTSVYNLGPKIVGAVTNLFEIPPALPPVGDWVYPNPPVDLANAQFPTTDLPAAEPDGTYGKYQLKLDLFDAAGNAVDIAAAGIGYYVPTTEDPDGTIHTANASTLGLVSVNSFIMTVHVDNRHTVGALGTPALDGTTPDPCGVFRYAAGPSGTVTIPYTAAHPDDFAIFLYRLSRGATLLTPPSTGYELVSPATNPATVSMSVVNLLTQPDGTVCDVAGFAEDLYVLALATDGWQRLAGYDSNPAPRAFVLAPA